MLARESRSFVAIRKSVICNDPVHQRGRLLVDTGVIAVVRASECGLNRMFTYDPWSAAMSKCFLMAANRIGPGDAVMPASGASTSMAFRRFTEVSLMIRSEGGVTARPALEGESACAREPRRLGFTTWLRCVPADGCCFRFVGILRPIRPTQLGFGLYSRGL